MLEWMKNMNMDVATWWNSPHEWMIEARAEYGEEYSDEKYMKWVESTFYSSMSDFRKDEPNCFLVPNGPDEVKNDLGVKEVQKILGFSSNTAIDHTAIAQVQYDRMKMTPDPKSPTMWYKGTERKLKKIDNVWMLGDQPSQLDCENLAHMVNMNIPVPDAAEFPRTFAWYCAVTRFTEAVRKSWTMPAEKKADNKAKGGKKEQKKKEEPKKEAKKEDDDDFDPFADEEEDEEAEKAKMARMKEIAKTAKSYGKVVVAKSLIIWEVKPWGEETDLDALAKKILAIEMDGLFWKTEYKKEPIAFGVFKIVIGATVEDAKVSTDLVQE